MSNTIEIKTKGFTELQAALNQFSLKAANLIERKATLAGAMVVKEDAQRFYNAWDRGTGTGRTKKNIKIKLLKSGSRWLCRYAVGISRYGMFMELGTKGHEIKAKRKKVLASGTMIADNNTGSIDKEYEIFGKKVKHPGTGAKPFLRPAFYNNIDRVIERMRQVMRDLITKEGGVI
jgi:HK97 gp10 family phage protein